MAARTRLSLLALTALVLAGCPDEKKGKPEDTGAVTSGVPLSGKLVKPTGTLPPASGSPSSATSSLKEDAAFPKAAIFEIYRAEQLLSGKDRLAVLSKHGLVDGNGKEDAARAEKYENALKAFVAAQPDEWSRFVDELESARAKAEASPDVPPK